LLNSLILNCFLGREQGDMLFVNDGDQRLHMQLMEPEGGPPVPRSLPKLASKVLGEFQVPPLSRKTGTTCACGLGFGLTYLPSTLSQILM
jgi:hypothetical protein